MMIQRQKEVFLVLPQRCLIPWDCWRHSLLEPKSCFKNFGVEGYSDDKLPDDVLDQWRAWKAELIYLDEVRITRYFTLGLAVSSDIELHAFGDASPNAYGSAVYAHVEDVSGQVRTQLLMSKSLVAPIKRMNLPTQIRIACNYRQCQIASFCC